MTTKINLHTIFRHLVGDNNFLSTTIETKYGETEQRLSDTEWPVLGRSINGRNQNSRGPVSREQVKKGFSLLDDMVTDYIPLVPYEKQLYQFFPTKVKAFLSPDYVRLGIKNVIEKNLRNINISFLNSLNMLLRPDLYKLSIEEHMRNLNLLEEFISHKISRNYQIDKIKRTRKIKAINKELVKNLSDGKISHELIQYIVNIFEINLLVFDFAKSDIFLYWAHGYKYSDFNMFNHLYCMAYVHGNYEPIMSVDKIIPKEQINKIYVQILLSPEIKCIPDLVLSVPSIELIDSWDLPIEQCLPIMERFYKSYQKQTKTFEELVSDLELFFK